MANKTPEISLYVDDIPMRLSNKYKPIDMSLYLGDDILIPQLISEDYTQYNFSTELYALEVAEYRKKANQEKVKRITDSMCNMNIDLKSSRSRESVKNSESEPQNSATNAVPNDPMVTTIQLNPGEILKPLTKGSNLSDIYRIDSNNVGIINRQLVKTINPKDFENDTSSPFDNVELQTIDDMRELNSVFQAFQSKANKHLVSEPSIRVNCNQNGLDLSANYGRQLQSSVNSNHDSDNAWLPYRNDSHLSHSHHFQSQVNHLRSYKSASDLPTLLVSDENVSHKKERSHTPPCYSSKVLNKQRKTKQTLILSDPYEELSQYSKDFVNSIILMGFERSRVARAVKHINNDEKKVIDFLLQVQALEEDGYDCYEAEIAVHMNNYQLLKAKKFLESLRHLSEVGFSKENIIKALVKCNNDRDKALDILLNSE